MKSEQSRAEAGGAGTPHLQRLDMFGTPDSLSGELCFSSPGLSRLLILRHFLKFID